MLARHLFGAIPAISPAFRITADGGMWSGKATPTVLNRGEYQYIGWLSNNGDVVVGVVYLPFRQLVRHYVLHPSLGGVSGTPDLHDSPSLLIPDASQKLVVAYSAHSGSHPLVRMSVSSLDDDPMLANGFGAESSIGSSGDWTYMSLVQMGSGWCYLIGRSVIASKAYIGWFYSSDEGVTWNTPPSNLMAYGADHPKGVYFLVAGDGDSKLHIVSTDTNRADGTPSSLYHVYLGFTGHNADGLYQSDGTLIAAYADWPIDITDGTLSTTPRMARATRRTSALVVTVGRRCCSTPTPRATSPTGSTDTSRGRGRHTPASPRAG